MMLSYWSTSSSSATLHLLPHNTCFSSRKQSLLHQFPISFKKPDTSFVCGLTMGVEQFAEITHNKVLVAATVSAAIGQLSKPFTSALLYRKNIDLKTVVRAGGFPSTHSAGVVAAATSLGLERGFADSIFGATVIFATLVMYDAQAVRREVGRHAKVLNKKILVKNQKTISYMNEDSLMDSKSGTSSITLESSVPVLSISETSTTQKQSAVDAPHLTPEIQLRGSSVEQSSLAINGESLLRADSGNLAPLQESIGHTEVEVVAGALLGFLVTLAVYSFM